VLNYSHYGDWVAVEKIPGPLVSTFFYYFAVDVVARSAAVLGNETEASAYRKLAAEIQAAFHNKFFNRETNSYGSGAQAAQVLALFLDLAPQELRGSAFRTLVNDIVYAKNTHLTTGIIGTKYLFPVLTRMGQSSLAYELATQTSYPSWGHMIENGATTIWELWQNKTGPAMNSHNHPAFGSIGAWFYQALAGINLVPDAPGFRRIRIEPHVVRDLGWASGTVETIRGTVSSSWRRTADGLRLEVTIPIGSEAEVHIPKLGLLNPVISEAGRPVWRARTYQAGVPGLTGAREADRAIVVQAGSGSYVFELADE
jgi:alpha-L-rhamnosidase